MEPVTQMILIEKSDLLYYLIDGVILFAFLALLRIAANTITGFSLTEVLATDDNTAAGIAFAGAIIAISILMMGVTSGGVGNTYINEITLMVIYGVSAILLLWLTRTLFDRLSLPDLNLHTEVMQGNIAAAITDAANMIASAMIVRATMIWVDGATFLGMVSVIALYIVSQLILYLATQYRIRLFQQHHGSKGVTLQSTLKSGNSALALRFSGYRLGVALALTATSGMIIYDPLQISLSITSWTAVAVVLFITQTLLSWLLRQILLPSINVEEEVVDQQNSAIGAIEAAIFIGVGFSFVGLLG
ncbi:MAG: DUF350 domain-containing protein [Gammaproteobacteria bacterium]|nr:DUF350 domain-containing protein [Gammaproteobacteria bacterium]